MEITFTRTGEHTYTTVARRDDGVTLAVPSHDRTAWMPHDVVHYLVERELGLARGFWGCVADGALFPGIKVLSGRQPPHAAARSHSVMREAGQAGTEAEVLVGVLLKIVEKGLDAAGPAARTMLAEAWRPDKPSRGPVEVAEAQRVCAALRAERERWCALSVGDSVTVTWPRDRRGRGDPILTP